MRPSILCDDFFHLLQYIYMCVHVNYYMILFELENNLKHFMMSFIMWLSTIEPIAQEKVQVKILHLFENLTPS